MSYAAYRLDAAKPYYKPSPRTLMRCLAISLAAHGLVLSLLVIPDRAAQPEQMLYVNLQLDTPARTATGSSQARKPMPLPPPEPVPASPAPKPDFSPKPEPAPPTAPQTESAPLVAPTQPPLRTMEELQYEISPQFLDHMLYPPMARNNHWEGTVVLALRVEPDGTISDIQIAHGSGYQVLDLNALFAMRYVKQLRPLAPGQEAMDVYYPVTYKLSSPNAPSQAVVDVPFASPPSQPAIPPSE